MRDIERVLKEVGPLLPPPREETIFSIGARSYYENPTSDLLAFFLDPNEVHGFGTLCLHALLEASGVKEYDLPGFGKPMREVATRDQKRIDILIPGREDVVVLENKVRHWVVNPLSSYEAYADRQYPGAKKHFIVLSPRTEQVRQPWVSVSYGKFFKHLKAGMAPHLFACHFSKWSVLLREFILNLENECEAEVMEAGRFAFVSQNYSVICEMEKMKADYVAEVGRRALDAIMAASEEKVVQFDSHVDDWGKEGQALRLFSSAWGGKSNITLLLLPSGGFRVQAYVYGIADGELDELRGFMDCIRYPFAATEQKTIRFFGYFNHQALSAALADVEGIARRLNAYFGRLHRG